jgi:hypothetical protein
MGKSKSTRVDYSASVFGFFEVDSGSSTFDLSRLHPFGFRLSLLFGRARLLGSVLPAEPSSVEPNQSRSYVSEARVSAGIYVLAR